MLEALGAPAAPAADPTHARAEAGDATPPTAQSSSLGIGSLRR
jgi:hypothetical protein